VPAVMTAGGSCGESRPLNARPSDPAGRCQFLGDGRSPHRTCDCSCCAAPAGTCQAVLATLTILDVAALHRCSSETCTAGFNAAWALTSWTASPLNMHHKRNCCLSLKTLYLS
jgi:hypothetical protein